MNVSENIDTQLKAVQALRDIAGMMSLRHPNILPVLGACIEPDSKAMCVIMPYMEKNTLSHLLHNETVELDLEAMLRILQDIAAAMLFVHQARPEQVYTNLTPHALLMDRNNRLHLKDFPVSTASSCIWRGSIMHKLALMMALYMASWAAGLAGHFLYTSPVKIALAMPRCLRLLAHEEERSLVGPRPVPSRAYLLLEDLIRMEHN